RRFQMGRPNSEPGVDGLLRDHRNRLRPKIALVASGFGDRLAVGSEQRHGHIDSTLFDMNAQVFPRVERDPVGVRLAAGDFAFDWMSRSERFPFPLASGGATCLLAC